MALLRHLSRIGGEAREKLVVRLGYKRKRETHENVGKRLPNRSVPQVQVGMARELKRTFRLLVGCDFVKPAGSLEQLSGARAVGGANQAIALHQINEMGSPAVADAQPALE